MRWAFTAGEEGKWRIVRMHAVKGASLAQAPNLRIVPAVEEGGQHGDAWHLYGQVSNIRYATRAELAHLKAEQAALGRDDATCAALILIRKSSAWWELAQDERREIFEEQSAHTAIGLEYLPAVARQLYHARDLGEPFDFLTWFEYAPSAAEAFESLVRRLRSTYEWTFVEREIDIRLEREALPRRWGSFCKPIRRYKAAST